MNDACGEKQSDYVGDNKSYTIHIERVANGWLVRTGCNIFVIQHDGSDNLAPVLEAVEGVLAKSEGLE